MPHSDQLEANLVN